MDVIKNILSTLTDLLCKNNTCKAAASIVSGNDMWKYYYPALICTPEDIFCNKPKEIRRRIWTGKFYLDRERQSLSFPFSGCPGDTISQK
jgi:hypothetical protein